MGNFEAWFGRSYKGIIVVLVAIMAVALSVLALQHVKVSASAEGASSAPIPTFGTTPKAERPMVAFIGDSYTGGTGATAKSKAFPQVLANKEGWRITVVACGGGGYVATGNCGTPYQDHLDDALAANPSIVVISGGRNDTTFPTEQVQANTATTLQRVKDALPNATIYVTSPIWDDDAPTDALTRVQTAVQAATTASGATYLDLGEPLEQHPEYVAADSVHPNDAGHASIADAIAARLPGK